MADLYDDDVSGVTGPYSDDDDDTDLPTHWGWSASVSSWDPQKLQLWAEFVVGVSKSDAGKVGMDGATLLGYPMDPTTELETALATRGVSEAGVRAIAAAYQCQLAATPKKVVEAWDKPTVVRWAELVLGFGLEDLGHMVKYRGRWWTAATRDQIPADLSPAAKAVLETVLETGVWCPGLVCA